MRAFIIRSVITAALLFLTVYCFYTGYWGWGITMIFVTALVGLTYVYNENLVLSLNQMRAGNQDKARNHINRIADTRFLPRRQRAYVIYLQAIMNVQEAGFTKSENQLRQAMSLGLKRGHDNAMARLQLAAIMAQTGRQREALTLLAEAKKFDNTGMMKEQIKMMENQLKMAPSKNQMRMAQMMGGRKKMPRSK